MRFFVSSSITGIKSPIRAVKLLAEKGYYNIELGSTHGKEKNLLSNLLKLKREYNLNFTVHNYFPPSEELEDVMINLCSVKWKYTLDVMKKGIEYAKKLNTIYTFHPSFRAEINKKFQPVSKLIPLKKAYDLFYKRFKLIYDYAKQNNVEIAIENLEYANDAYILCDPASLNDFFGRYDIKFLFDIGHLAVASKKLGFAKEEILGFKDRIIELHINDNTIDKDAHLPVGHGNVDYSLLRKIDMRNKIIVPELAPEYFNYLEDSIKKIKMLIKN